MLQKVLNVSTICHQIHEQSVPMDDLLVPTGQLMRYFVQFSCHFVIDLVVSALENLAEVLQPRKQSRASIRFLKRLGNESRIKLIADDLEVAIDVFLVCHGILPLY